MVGVPSSSSSFSLLNRLPKVRGTYRGNVLLSQYTWFKVGGPAEIFFKPADEEDLSYFLKELPKDISYTLLGVGSNVLIRSGGVTGVVIRLGTAFSKIQVLEGDKIWVGAAQLDRTVALEAQKIGIGGLEFLIGIPGTIGGALRMNAGAYGKELKDILVKAYALDEQGNYHILNPQDMGFSYRSCALPEKWIFIGACLQGIRENPSIIQSRMDDILQMREASQPIRARTGGSTFANPANTKAWELIDKVGGRGLKRGGAQISEKHCNFLINTGNATSEDLEELGLEIQKRVLDKTGIELQWEIKRIGEYS